MRILQHCPIWMQYLLPSRTLLQAFQMLVHIVSKTLLQAFKMLVHKVSWTLQPLQMLVHRVSIHVPLVGEYVRDIETPPDEEKWYVLTQTWDDKGALVWAHGLRKLGCRPWHEVNIVNVLETKMKIRFHISMYLT
ncbi:hypothetical protein Q3G72_029943 [Acer saccharum]|nr:hypothetical protein Q3G72_029943 [Acer saccharum]